MTMYQDHPEDEITLNKTVASGSKEVCALRSDAIPGPLEHLDDDIFRTRWSPRFVNASMGKC